MKLLEKSFQRLATESPTKVALPLLNTCQCAARLSEPNEPPELPKLGKLFCVWKHSQQIKCTSCMGLELAAVQLICGILSRSLLPQSTQLASSIAFYIQRTHNTCMPAHTPTSEAPFLLELCTPAYIKSRVL